MNTFSGAGSGQPFEVVGTTPYDHEREALEWLQGALPTYHPFGGFALFSFQTEDNRRYELDAVVMTTHCLYVIEFKSWRGTLVDGDVRDLVFESGANRRRTVSPHPLPLLEMKTKALKARVVRVARRLAPDAADAMERLWFEPIVWFSHADKSNLPKSDAAHSHVVVGRSELPDLIRRASFAGARDGLAKRETTTATFRVFQRVMREAEFGLKRREKLPSVLDGRFDLKELVEEGPDYQDHWGEPRTIGPLSRVRSYLTPKSDRAYVQRLQQRVEREAKILSRLADHPNILALEQFDPAGPYGPALIFRGFEGTTVESFLKQHRQPNGRSDLSIDDKLSILKQVADALVFCHRKGVKHGALSPEAVLVFKPEGSDHPVHSIAVKLTRFALAASTEAASEGTRLFTRLAGSSAGLYEAPEIAQGAPITVASDIFSLGALAYFLFAEQPPAANPWELEQRVTRDGGLVLSAVYDGLFAIDEVLKSATSINPAERETLFPTPAHFVEELENCLTAPDEDEDDSPVSVGMSMNLDLQLLQVPEGPRAPKPAALPPILDPLHAKAGDVLGDLRVVCMLGSGASARVFKVRRVVADGAPEGEDDFALKVPLSDTHDDAIRREADILKRLARGSLDRVARWIDTRDIAGRTCLLVQFAGDNTLADEIRTEGSLSLDYARRWGEDLLDALRSLEEAGVQHRDIKPANIGLHTINKKKKRLLLFDFSLSDRPADDLGIGTPAYKDPALRLRGHWDDAADRWAAAITLYEMFTGKRPAPIVGVASGAGPKTVAVRLEPDRFDADVRDGLKPFFEKALLLDAANRFATADDMRDAFRQALNRVQPHDGPVEEHVVSKRELQGLGPETRVGDLAISVRAKNALDRLGIFTLHELSQLSNNALTIRGVGAKTAQELVDLAVLVREHLEVSASEVVPAFFRGFAGETRRLAQEDGLSDPLRTRLVEAGLFDSSAVAAAPQSHVKNLVGQARKQGATETAKDLTKWLESLVDAAEPPTTLGAALECLAPNSRTSPPAKSAANRRLRQYLGIELLDGFPLVGSMFELARALDISRPALSLDIAKARERWLGDRNLSLLPNALPDTQPQGNTQASSHALTVLVRAFESVRSVLEAHAGVVSLGKAAAAVMATFPPEPDLPIDTANRTAEALVRAITIVPAGYLGGAEGMQLQFRRIGEREVGQHAPGGSAGNLALVGFYKEVFTLAGQLGAEADQLVERDGVVGEAAAAAHLRAHLGTGLLASDEKAQALAGLPDKLLVELAVCLAQRACISARGELYVVGLSAERAILLSASAIALTNDRSQSMARDGLPLVEVQRRVHARYPESALLPTTAAELVAIAATLSLRYDAEKQSFATLERAQETGSTELGDLRTFGPITALVSGEKPAYPSGGEVPSLVARERELGDVLGATAIRVFEEELQRAKAERSFRILLWRGRVATAGKSQQHGAPYAERVAQVIAAHLAGKLCVWDQILLEKAEEIATEKKIPLRGDTRLHPAFAADAAGPDGPHWTKLLELMRPAAARALAALLAQDHVAVLTRLGLLARYELLGIVGEMALAFRTNQASQQALFVVLPLYVGEAIGVEVASDIVNRASQASPQQQRTRLAPIPGILPHEILEVPAAWMQRHAALAPSHSTSRRPSAQQE